MDVTVDRLRLLRAGAGLALIAALGLTACAPDEDSAAFDDSEPASDQEQDDSAADEDEPDEEPESDADGENEDDAADEDEGGEDDADGEEDNADGATGAVDTPEGPINPDDAVDTVSFSIPREDIEGTITVGVHELRVNDNTMQLLLSYTPEFGEHETYTMHHLMGDTSAHPSLTDRENLKRYSVLRPRQSASPWATIMGGAGLSLADGETMLYWGNYPVPEDDIETVNVSVFNAAPELEDVEIEWGDGEPSEDLGEDDPEADMDEGSEEDGE